MTDVDGIRIAEDEGEGTERNNLEVCLRQLAAHLE